MLQDLVEKVLCGPHDRRYGLRSNLMRNSRAASSAICWQRMTLPGVVITVGCQP